jgi:transposase
MRRDDICLFVSPANRARLDAIINDRNSAAKAVWRAQIVLATADGHGTNEIMRRTGKSKPCVWRWQERFAAEGVDGLLRDKTRPSRVPPLTEDVRLAVLTKTATETPANATHWSRSSMAAAAQISPSSVGRIWREAGLKPHRIDTFKVSNDPLFEEKVVDIVGLYMRPPDKALVLCVDEKSQIQALDRSQPGLPMKKGRAQTMTHDYKRHGTTTLFAALDVKSGLVIGDCQPRHRAKEFIRFLKKIDRTVQKHLDLHLIMDNYSTHKTALYSNVIVLAQPRRALLCRDHRQAHQAGHIPQRRRAGSGHSGLPAAPQCQRSAIHLDQVGRNHPRQRTPRPGKTTNHQSREPSVRLGTLVDCRPD